jgi:hypothetical protein
MIGHSFGIDHDEDGRCTISIANFYMMNLEFCTIYKQITMHFVALFDADCDF